MPKRKKLTDADVKKVESVILSDTDVEKRIAASTVLHADPFGIYCALFLLRQLL